MSEPLGTCKACGQEVKLSNGAYWCATEGCSNRGPIGKQQMQSPATDQLNQQIRDVTSGKKEIVTKHPDSGGATCVCGHGQTEHSWVSANTLNPLEFTRDGYCLAKPCLCGTFTPAPQEPQDGRRSKLRGS